MKMLDQFAYWRRTQSNGSVIEVVPLTFGRARIVVGDGKRFVYDGW